MIKFGVKSGRWTGRIEPTPVIFGLKCGHNFWPDPIFSKQTRKAGSYFNLTRKVIWGQGIGGRVKIIPTYSFKTFVKMSFFRWCNMLQRVVKWWNSSVDSSPYRAHNASKITRSDWLNHSYGFLPDDFERKPFVSPGWSFVRVKRVVQTRTTKSGRSKLNKDSVRFDLDPKKLNWAHLK